MRHRRTPPALIVGALVAVLAVSIGIGWLAASQMAEGGTVVAGLRAEPGEPAYDAGDPADAPAIAPSSADVREAQPLPPDPAPVPVPASTDRAPAPAAAPTQNADPSGAGGAARTPDAPAAPAPRDDVPTGAGAPQVPPPTTTGTAPAPAPAGDAPADLRPYAPPPAIGIAAEALPAEGRAWSILTAARRSAPAGSQERADLDWLIAFARTAAGPSAPAGRRATARRALRVNAWWYARRAAPDDRVIARDPDGVILTYKRGHGFMVNPVATMGRWRDLNDAWTPAQLAEALLPMLSERTRDGREWAALEYFDVPGDPTAVRPGVSGMGQARAVSLLSKAWGSTGDPRFLQAAQRVLRSLTVPVDEGGVLARVRDPGGGAPGDWYPERAYPGQDAWTGAALNGFMVTLIELRRAADGLAATRGADAGSTSLVDETAALARDLADRGERSLVRFLPIHDSGAWSYYGLLTPGKPWRTYLADLNYHCYHVVLLRALDGLYPGDGLGAVADRWSGYVDARGATCPDR